MQIVIADDEGTTRRLLRTLLSRAGYEVLEATDGESAWALLQTSGATLLITDWRMPQLDGPKLIQRIRTANAPAYIYCILLTARDSTVDIVSGLDSGADDYLAKPFHPDELRARVAIGVRLLALETGLRAARDAFAFQANHDPLTGLPNRLAITTHVQAELARANRSSYPLSVALLDLDHFKQVNDTYGHLVGDQALCHVAQVLMCAVRPYDWVGRWGGEEFLIILANTCLDEALTIAERLRIQIAASPLYCPDAPAVALTASIGVAGTGLPTIKPVNPVWLFQQADAALYTAKHLGRNQVCQPPTMRERGAAIAECVQALPGT